MYNLNDTFRIEYARACTRAQISFVHARTLGHAFLSQFLVDYDDKRREIGFFEPRGRVFPATAQTWRRCGPTSKKVIQLVARDSLFLAVPSFVGASYDNACDASFFFISPLIPYHIHFHSYIHSFVRSFIHSFFLSSKTLIHIFLIKRGALIGHNLALFLVG